MALTLNFRDITPEDTRILRMVALRNGKAEDYLCCDVTTSILPPTMRFRIALCR